jgi:hypothetical protein
MASRKVVTEFAAFGAPKNASVFGTAVQSTPFSLAGGTAAFGALRTNKPPGTMEDDEDDDDDAHDGPQRVELREDSITLDQASPDRSSLSSSQVLTRTAGKAHRDVERMAERPQLAAERVLHE